MSTIAIPLTHGKAALIDSDDYECVGSYRWRAVRATHGRCWYAVASIKDHNGRYKTIQMQRLILGARKGVQVDHESRDGLDNRRHNLRLATCSQNKANTTRYDTNRSGFKGVYWKAKRHLWEAQICHQGVLHYLGYFTSAEDAARAYDRQARALFGSFACCNFPNDGSAPIPYRTGVLRGSRNGNARLTDEAVRDIRAQRAQGVTLPVLAAEYGVSQSLVSAIARRKIWRHVE